MHGYTAIEKSGRLEEAENCRKIFFAFRERHRLRVVANGHIKEFLND